MHDRACDQTVAETMAEHKLIRVRMRKMDDIGNEIKNGGRLRAVDAHYMHAAAKLA